MLILNYFIIILSLEIFYNLNFQLKLISSFTNFKFFFYIYQVHLKNPIFKIYFVCYAYFDLVDVKCDVFMIAV
jgi:hypothetical protein